ncbi:hypothetical protein F2P45_22175 [Massilia sp. CCM 8733]|uniref:Type 4 fimbrial biogenesis protein PilX N-terminal domain-containing protein n=1 Tax=Massilia mucilaginosa TaxID=2609282 RepID=A0ABX0NZD4_9BURK|nr:hypothetical protein [Massilia mucilaginosa]NHZ91692.1 hypothetical protein [Massilia mucilaginosa]
MTKRNQQGMALITSLIMLVVLTMLALTSFNLGKSNLIVVGNMQQRDGAIAAARGVIEEVISNKRFASDSANTLDNPCELANQRCIDVNGDEVADVTVAITPAPSCKKVQVMKNSDLDLNDEEERNCMISSPDATSGDSLCANTVWEVRAVATDAVAQSTVELVQGIKVRVPLNDVEDNCPI